MVQDLSYVIKFLDSNEQIPHPEYNKALDVVFNK